MPTRRSTEAAAATQGLEVSFHEAIMKVAALVDASQVNEAGTTISKFTKHSAAVLDRTEQGALEVITRNNQRYVILGEEQITALAKNARSGQLAGELLADLPRLPYQEHRPRVRP